MFRRTYKKIISLKNKLKTGAHANTISPINLKNKEQSSNDTDLSAKKDLLLPHISLLLDAKLPLNERTKH